jgi:hypothetical protein
LGKFHCLLDFLNQEGQQVERFVHRMNDPSAFDTSVRFEGEQESNVLAVRIISGHTRQPAEQTVLSLHFFIHLVNQVWLQLVEEEHRD